MMKGSYILRVILALGVLGICGGLRADPLPGVVAEILGSNPEIRVFAVDDANEPLHKPREREEGYRKRYAAFLEKQRAGSRVLTDAQKKATDRDPSRSAELRPRFVFSG